MKLVEQIAGAIADNVPTDSVEADMMSTSWRKTSGEEDESEETITTNEPDVMHANLVVGEMGKDP